MLNPLVKEGVKVMELDEINKQREIGKYLMIVDIIRYENKHNKGMGISFVSIEDLAAWASIKEEEVETLVEYFKRFDPYRIAISVANQLTADIEIFKSDGNAAYFTMQTCRNLGQSFICYPYIELKARLDDLAALNYDNYLAAWAATWPINKDFQETWIFESIMRTYVQNFCNIFKEALEHGYDRDVINRIIGFEVTRERFSALQEEYQIEGSHMKPKQDKSSFFEAVGKIDIDSTTVNNLRNASQSMGEKSPLFADDVKEEHDNKHFEEAVFRIMQMKDSKTYRSFFLKEQSFELIYDISVYGIVPLSDERIGRCILWKYSRGENGEPIDNYKGLDEGAKIDAFYSFFEKHVSTELSKYGCTDKKLIDMLNCGN